MSNSYRGPLLGNADAMAGALSGAPIGVLADTQWVQYFNDFTRADTDYDVNLDWSPTVFTAGVQQIASYNDVGIGILRIDGGAGADQGAITQLDGSASVGRAPMAYDPIASVAGTSVASEAIFAARFRIRDVSAQAIFVGLAELHATSNVLTASASTLTVSDNHIGFHQISTDNGLIRYSTAGTAIANLVTDTSVVSTKLEDDDWIEVAVRLHGTTGHSAYVRPPGGAWTKVASGVGTAWNEQMVISLGNVGAGADDDLDVDYIYFARKRDLVGK